MRHRVRRGSEGLLAPNLTPLLDVVLQLITFFMMLIHFGNKLEGESTAIRLPKESVKAGSQKMLKVSKSMALIASPIRVA